MHFLSPHKMYINDKVGSMIFLLASSLRLTRWAGDEDADRFVVRLLCTMDLEGCFADMLDL
jgi:hypothetical protein